MATAVEVEGLSKRYRLGLIGGKTLREDLQRWWALLRGRPDPLLLVGKSESNLEGEYIWALRDVGFSVSQGEVVGIIGRNGAGKSTLLKVLTRITAPTSGHARMMGRVASMLEVGTGFHPELTGRENVYLNGAILGMTKADVDRRFDEIVDFSGVEQFIDTPIKRYSSGMTVRLAFAVAAHLEPEILLIDEVLAVGDAAFQKRCVGKMGQVVSEGRTILFVSHNMGAIRNLCRRTLCIENGRLVMDDETERVVSYYLDQGLSTEAVLMADAIEAVVEGSRHPPTVQLRRIAICGDKGDPRNSFHSDEAIHVSIRFKCLTNTRDLRVLVQVVDDDGVPILATQNLDDPAYLRHHHELESGTYDAEVVFPPNTFGERQFFLSVQLINPKTEHLHMTKCLAFDTRFKGFNNVQYGSNASSYLRPQLSWALEPITQKAVQVHVSR